MMGASRMIARSLRTMTTSNEIRRALIETLALDLVGAEPGNPLESEELR
jgi:hypothetical protein